MATRIYHLKTEPNAVTVLSPSLLPRPPTPVVVRGCKLTDKPEHGHATADANAEETAAELSSAAQVQAKLEAMTRDQLAAKVADYNATAAADKKIVIAPTVGKPELVEKLLAVLVTTE